MDAAAPEPPLAERVAREQLRAHYAMIPAMVAAPLLGGLFTAWVLWEAVPRATLKGGLALLLVLSALRLGAYGWHRRCVGDAAVAPHWKVLAVGMAFASGCLWGSAAPLLYPPLAAGYEVFLLVLLALVPIVPVAALASWLPAFYAYFLPCAAPFIVTLALAGTRAEALTALLLLMMLTAMLTFARRYARSLAEAIALRLQLAEQSQALERTMRHRGRFVAAASHDLREPLHAMGLFLEALPPGADAATRDAVGHLHVSLQSLQAMLGDMLDVSRLEAGAVAVQRQPVAARALLQRLHDEYAPQAQRRGLRLRLRAADLVLDTDARLLERMLRNLLSNALKYTARGGVLLSCRRRGAGAVLQICDTGRGMAETDLARAFEEFTRLPGADGSGGVGLGLAIVQRLSEVLGHPLTARSRPGHGSVFTLAVGRADGALARPAPVPRPVDGVAAAPLEILVVDDDADVAEGTAALLRSWGHRAGVAMSVAAAAARLGEAGGRTDLLLVDHELGPGGPGGLQALAPLRAAAGRALPAIVVTANTSQALIREAYDAGCPLLHKPVDPGRLRACVDAVTGRR